MYTVNDVVVIAEGMCYMSVCVPADIDPNKIEGLVSPSGTLRGWKVCEDEKFKTGHDNPCSCEQTKDRLHYLLDC